MNRYRTATDDDSVLIITERYYPENFLINDLVRRWVTSGKRVDVLTQVPSYPADRLYDGYPNHYSHSSENGASVFRVRTVLGYRRNVIRKILGYLAFSFRASVAALLYFRNHHRVFVYHTGPLTQAIPVIFLKLFGSCRRTVIWTQDVWPDAVHAYGFASSGPTSIILKAFVRTVYRFFDDVLVSSPGFVRRLLPYMRPGLVPLFVPQWVSSEFENARPTSFRPDPDAVSFIYTGNIGTMQNLENVIQAFGEAYARSVPVHLYLVGHGSQMSYLRGVAAENGLQNVSFIGKRPQDEIKSIIQECKFVVLSLTNNPLISMTIPAKFQTYLSAGRPILCVAEGEVATMVREFDLGVTADPEDVVGIVERIGEMTGSSDSKHAAWSLNMKDLLINSFSAENATTRITDALMKS